MALVPSIFCQMNGELRLRNGSYLHEGLVEEFSAEYNEWINFCVDGFDAQEARVVCRNLGFPDAAFALDTDAVFGSDTQSYYAVSLDCEGTEPRLVDCSYQDLPDCAVGFGAAVICQKPDYVGCFHKPNSSILHTHSIFSRTMTVDACLRNCRDGGFSFAWTFDSMHCGCGNYNDLATFSQSDAVCSCPCGGAIYETCGGPTCSQGTSDMISVYNAQKGFCLDPGRPRNGRRAGNWFRYGSKVNFECQEGHRLRGHETLQCMQAVMGGEVTWSQSTPSCQAIKTKKVEVEETTVSTIDATNSSSTIDPTGETAPPTRDILKINTLSGEMIGVIAAIPVTVLLVTSVIVVAVIRKQRKRATNPMIEAIRCDLLLKESPPKPESPPAACPKPRKLLPGSGSFTLPIRTHSSNSSDYYASIDLYNSDADYENIARKKITAQSGKEVFVPLFGSRVVHHAKSGIVRTLNGPVPVANLLHYHSQHRIGEPLRRDTYEDTTIMVDNDLYASRDEFPSESSEQPEPPARTKHLVNSAAERIVEGAEESDYTEADFLPEEAAQG
ncbi:uncharacterized protein LOC121431210 [Lytechinus variegatus]|uniref:uncharacterized protein LOC121431210 n=1 Tax=Lytechinus variegatus TaxID=7654 RepID=UPI001BB27707|nr:uncharacterized protein LOC121431210 [Lytechinus variegatus]